VLYTSMACCTTVQDSLHVWYCIRPLVLPHPLCHAALFCTYNRLPNFGRGRHQRDLVMHTVAVSAQPERPCQYCTCLLPLLKSCG
jgi:hypothetical protein